MTYVSCRDFLLLIVGKNDGLRDAKTPFQQCIYTHFRLEITTYSQPFFQFSKNGSKIRLIPI